MNFRKFNELNDFLKNLHEEGFGLISYQNNKIPCIYVKREIYDNILKKTYGKKYVVEVLLNIFYNGKYMFVDIMLDFTNLGLEENFLMNVRDIEFFELLYQHSLLSIIPIQYLGNSSSNIFVIQLPKKDKINNVLEIIKSNMVNIQHQSG